MGLALTSAALAAGTAQANSTYIPPAGSGSLTPSYSYQSFQDFTAGDADMSLPGDIVRQSWRVYLDLGLAPDWALDLSLGYSDVEFEPTGQSQQVLADTYVGVRYKFLHEETSGFAAAVRMGALIAGDYETGFFDAPGDGENGADVTLIFSKQLTEGGLTYDGALGYRVSANPVPDAWWSTSRLTLPLGGGFFVDGRYSYYAGTSGPDIGGSGFSGLQDLPSVQEEVHVVEIGVAFADAGGRYYRAYGAQVIDGRNVGEEETWGLSVTFPF